MADIMTLISHNLTEILIIAGLLAAVISFFKSVRQHAIKLFVVMFITALAIYSNNWAVYFISVIIIATLITELDFLQNIVAIIRDNKYYFKYRKTIVGKEELESKDKIIKSVMVHNSANSEGLNRNEIYILEQLALEHIEKKLGVHINRNIKVYRNNLNMILDGLIDNDDKYADKIFEVKLIQSNRSLQELIYKGKSLINTIYLKYANITGKKPEIFLLVITPNKADFMTSENVIKIYSDLSHPEYKITIHLLTFENIGFDPNDHS